MYHVTNNDSCKTLSDTIILPIVEGGYLRINDTPAELWLESAWRLTSEVHTHWIGSHSKFYRELFNSTDYTSNEMWHNSDSMK